MLSRRKPYTLRKIIDYIRKKFVEDKEYQLYQDKDWCIYSDSIDLTMKSVCYIDDYASVNDHDDEIPPEFVRENALQFVYSSVLITDVIGNALYQNEFADNDLIFKALVYYDKNDCYLDIKSASIKKKKFTVIIAEIGYSKISVIKSLTDLLEISTAEANKKLSKLPLSVLTTSSREKAENIRKKLTVTGAKVIIK